MFFDSVLDNHSVLALTHLLTPNPPLRLILSYLTGCGKTEIARRIAKLSQAPFIKVEATKFTEVGFHGKDVDQIIRDLVDISINMTKQRIKEVSTKLI